MGRNPGHIVVTIQIDKGVKQLIENIGLKHGVANFSAALGHVVAKGIHTEMSEQNLRKMADDSGAEPETLPMFPDHPIILGALE